MNLFEIHVYHHHVVHIPNVKFKERLRHVHVYRNILAHRQIADLNVLVTANVRTI